MTITLQASPHDQLEESLATSAGRFGRQIGMIAWPDPELASVRSATVLGMRARVQYRDYQIDSFVLAEAIIDRLSAGGLTTPLQEQAVQGERSRRGERVSLVSRLRTRRCPRWAKYFALARQRIPMRHATWATSRVDCNPPTRPTAA
jgi:hypothetical protein